MVIKAFNTLPVEKTNLSMFDDRGLYDEECLSFTQQESKALKRASLN